MGRISHVTLPPQVDGPTKGTLTFNLGRLELDSPPGPSLDGSASVTIKWWGDDSPGDILEPSGAVGGAIQFQLRSGPKYMARYFADVGSLGLLFKQPAGSSSQETAIIGTASVDIRSLGVGAPVSGTFAIVGDQGKVIGRIPLSLSLAFNHPAVTSFELNEHLAGFDAAPPRYSTTDILQPSGNAAESTQALEGRLHCPATFRQLEQAMAEDAFTDCLSQFGSCEGGALSAADVERLLRQLLPGVSEGAVGYAAAVLALSQPEHLTQEQAWLSITALVSTVRECARLERGMEEDAGAAARKLRGLVSLLSSRHLDVIRAFSEADSDRDEEISYQQLVAMLRTLSPGISPYELHCMLVVLAGMDEAGAGRVLLSELKQAVTAISYAQAYPNEEELQLQQQAAAAREAKAAAAASALAVADRRQPESPSASQPRHLAVGKLRQTLEQGRGKPKHAAAPAGSTAGVDTVAVANNAVQPPAPPQAGAAATHAADGHGASGSTEAYISHTHDLPLSAAQPASFQQQPTAWGPALQPWVQPGTAGMGVAGGPPADSNANQQAAPSAGAIQPVQLAPGVGAGGVAVGMPGDMPAAMGMQPLQQPLQPQQHAQLGQVVGWPCSAAGGHPQQVAVGMPLQQQPWPAQQPLQPAVGSDALQALISRAEQLQLAMNRAALNSSQPLLGPASTAVGILGAPLHSTSVPQEHLSMLLSTVQPSLAALECAAMGDAGGFAAMPDPASKLRGITGAAVGLDAEPDCRLSAASAALVLAAKALSRGRQAKDTGSMAQLDSLPGPGASYSAAGVRDGQVAGASHEDAQCSIGRTSLEQAVQQAGAKIAPDAGSEGSWDDPAELAEDIMLQELFFSRTAQPGLAAVSSLGARQQDQHHGGAATGQDQQPEQKDEHSGEVPAHASAPELVLTLRLGVLRLLQKAAAGGLSDRAAKEGPWALSTRAAKVRGVVKPLHSSAQPLPFAMEASSGATASATLGGCCSPEPVVAVRFEGEHAGEVQLEVEVPAACVEQGRLPSTLFIEVWDQANKLVGIVRAALSLCHLPPSQGGPGSDLPAVVCDGRWDVWNVLEGRAEGSVDVFAVVQEKSQPRVLPAVRHGFSVTIQTAYRLPGNVAYAEAKLQGPDARYIKYTFPGEPEPLYTKDVPVMSNPTFDATAHHSITLLPDQDIATILSTGGSRRLRFEVWDQWVDGRQELHAWAEMGMAELAGLVKAASTRSAAGTAADTADGGSNAAPAASQSRLLPLITEYDSAPGTAASAKGPALRLDLAYHTERVLVPVPSDAEMGRGGRRGDTQARSAQSLPSGANRHVLHGTGNNAAPGEPSSQQQPAADVSGRCKRPEAQAGASRRQRPPAAVPAHSHTAREVALGGGFGADEGSWSNGEDAENNVLLANCSPARPVKATAAAPKGIEAVLCVEIIRACGLAAAIKEACAFTSGNTALNRARQVGAHPFARLALFPSDALLQKRAPPLQTPFQAQTFCPEFHARHEYCLRMDSRMLQALAEQDLLVELWHHLPRTQAVAAALPAGRSSVAAGPEAGGLGEREVFLGRASGPLLDVVRKPQGFRGWLGLKSRRGEAVGAVQVAVYFAEVQGQPVFASVPDRSPLLQCDSLPDIVPSQLGWLLQSTGIKAFRGQQATATVAVEEVTPPQEESFGRDAERPKAELYFASYRLPGAPCSQTTAAKTLTAGAGKAPAASAAVSSRAWSAKLGHVGTFQVTAGPALLKALSSFPLTITVYRQPAPGGKLSRAAVLPPVQVGTAEVDLAGLLWTRHSNDSAPRTITGSYLLVEPTAKALGNARVRVRVSLDLAQAMPPKPNLEPQPGRPAGRAAAAGGTDLVEGSWEVEGEEGDASQECSLEDDAEPAAECADADAEAGMPADTAHAERPCGQICSERLGGMPGSLGGHAPEAASAAAAGRDSRAAAAAPAADGGAATQCSPAAQSSPAPASHQQLPAQGPAPAPCPHASGMREHGGAGGTHGSGSNSPSGTDMVDTPQASGLGSAPAEPPQGSSSSAGSAAASPHVAAEEPPPPFPHTSGKLLVHVESAVHLPPTRPQSATGRRRCVDSSSGGSSSDTTAGEYCSYVSLTWGPQKAKYSTVAVAVQGRAGPSAGTAAWGEVIQLDADASTFPVGALGGAAAAAQAGSGGDRSRGTGPSGGPILLLNVWSSPPAAIGTAGAGPGPAPGSRGASPLPAGPGHALIGCAAVDLTTLPLLGEVRGYWNVVDYMQQVRGQLRLTVRPDAVLEGQLAGARRPGAAFEVAGAAATAHRAAAAAAAAGGGRVRVAAPAGAAGSGSSHALCCSTEPAVASRHAAEEEAAPASSGGLADEAEGEEAGDALLGELQARMEALQLLSQRLSREPSAAEAAPSSRSQAAVEGNVHGAVGQPTGDASAAGAAATAARRSGGYVMGSDSEGDASSIGTSSSTGSSRRGSDRRVADRRRRRQPGHEAVRQPAAVCIRQIAASDEEDEGGWLPRPPHAPGRHTWSSDGSDDDDDLALLGIAVEGAVSPGGMSDGPDEEPQRPPGRPRFSSLMAADWMFDISVPPPSDPVPCSTEPMQHEQDQGESGRSAPYRVTFQNVLPPAIVPAQLPSIGDQHQQQVLPLQGPGSLPPAASAAEALDRAASPPGEPLSSLRPLPILPQPPAATQLLAGAAELGSVPGRGSLLGQGVRGISGHGVPDDWVFDISKRPAPSSMAFHPAAAAAGAASPSAQPLSSLRPLPILPQPPAGVRSPAAAGSAPGRGSLLGQGMRGISGHGVPDDWLFDISKRAGPSSPAVQPAAAAAGAGPALHAGSATGATGASGLSQPAPSSYHQYLTLRSNTAGTHAAAGASRPGDTASSMPPAAQLPPRMPATLTGARPSGAAGPSEEAAEPERTA